MAAEPLVNCMANGTLALPDKLIQARDCAWVAHPTFAGVYLKHLLQGEDTDGQLSCHMVKIEPGCTLEQHVHAEQWELHEVIDGAGHCRLAGSMVPYAPGQMAVIPRGTPHAVTADREGLVLLAKFFPALC